MKRYSNLTPYATSKALLRQFTAFLHFPVYFPHIELIHQSFTFQVSFSTLFWRQFPGLKYQ